MGEPHPPHARGAGVDREQGADRERSLQRGRQEGRVLLRLTSTGRAADPRRPAAMAVDRRVGGRSALPGERAEEPANGPRSRGEAS
ncbi:hypothetical protein SBRY_11331 [Actinacidiphila bryophytorum]|uniref:Uncharacterized protein n=1 Tax=Actinacidiphila bryophytorum TaxID=1436133 RepID=A0A9W4E4S2_9ACTN|nr:hypothetical protein SBRY_11331 [Actinacidiphila bryophytorum]